MSVILLMLLYTNLIFMSILITLLFLRNILYYVLSRFCFPSKLEEICMRKFILFICILLFIPCHANASINPTVKLTPTSITVENGEIVLLKAKVNMNLKCLWTSSNTKIATVNNNGCVTTKKPGKVKITARVGKSSAFCYITVVKASVQLSRSELTLRKGQTFTLKATSSLKSNSKIVFSASSGKVLTVDSRTGKVRAVGKGIGYVYAFHDGHKARCRVVVR